MVKSTKTTISTKKHEDRELAAKTAFESTSVEIQSPQTMILLLASKEDFVILKALSSLDRYASKLQQNAQVLYEEGILRLLLPLINHSELYVKRFTSKILSQLCFLPQVAEVLLQKELIEPIVDILDTVDDFVVKEFSSSIVAELTRTNVGLTQLLRSNCVSSLIPLLSSPDPDIKKNCLQIICNLIQDPYDHTILTREAAFSVKVFLDLLMSDYLAIQHLSLDILNTLTQRRRENNVSKDFQDLGGVLKILMILKNFEWKDIHSKCLDILGNIYDDPNIAQHFLKDGVLQLFNYLEFINDPLLRKQAVEVIAKITKIPLGRKVLTEGGRVAGLVALVLEQSVGLTAAASHCLAGLVQDSLGLQQVLAVDAVKDLLMVISDNNRHWDCRTSALNALYEILLRDSASCKLVIASDYRDVFEVILGQYDKEMPTHAAVLATNCITVLASNTELKQRIVTEHLISSLLQCFQSMPEDTTAVKVSGCEALSCLLSEPEARRHLQTLDGLTVVWTSISAPHHNTQLLQSTAQFLHLCVTHDKGFTDTLLRLGVLPWLLSRSSLRYECPAWETALETVFNKFLPIKFAISGRLDLTDVTESGFYITKVPLTREQLNKNKFPILNNLISSNCCPIHTLYYANFDEGGAVQGSWSISSGKKSTISTRSGESSATLDNSYDCEKFRLADFYLLKYINSLKTLLEQNGFSVEKPSSIKKDSQVEGDTVHGKALVIGQFVARQMSGVDNTERCSAHTLGLHINELKVEVMNSIIPVGWMRVGLHLERAFLFKVLADRVGLPASLVRGEYGQRAWVEVALPSVPPPPRPSYPNHLLRPNHVVDLMDDPGTLYPLNSYKANVYCGLV